MLIQSKALALSVALCASSVAIPGCIGEEVASSDVVPGRPFVLSYTQTGDEDHAVWVDMDIAFQSGPELRGPIRVTSGEGEIASYTFEFRGGKRSPIRERSGWRAVSWVSSPRGARGKTHLFPIPSQGAGAQVQVAGTISAGPGTTVEHLRIFASR